MNIANINRLIEHLRTNFDEVGFNMYHYEPTESFDRSGHGCETACCLAGHIELMEPKFALSTFETGREFLDITHEEADALFEPAEGSGEDRLYYADITSAIAIRTLERFRDEGVISYLDAIELEKSHA